MSEEHDETTTEQDESSTEQGESEAWAPWGTFSEIQEAVGGFVDSALRNVGPGGARFPRCDLVALVDGGHRLSFDLPGLEKSEVDVTIKGRELTVAGERARPALPDGAEVRRSERSFGKFRRSVRIPDDADVDRVSAKMSNGVLVIDLIPAATTEEVKIEVE